MSFALYEQSDDYHYMIQSQQQYAPYGGIVWQILPAAFYSHRREEVILNFHTSVILRLIIGYYYFLVSLKEGPKPFHSQFDKP